MQIEFNQGVEGCLFYKPGDVNRSSAEMRMSPRELPVDVFKSCLKTTNVCSILLINMEFFSLSQRRAGERFVERIQ